MWPVQHFSKGALFGIGISLVIIGLDSCHCQQTKGGKTEVYSTQVRSCRRGRIYFPPTQRCYTPGRKGPCGELMTFVRSTTSKTVGECRCEDPGSPFDCFPQRPLIFVKQFSRCYPIFHQGPCQMGEWLVPREGNTGVCKRIACPRKYRAQFSSTPETETPPERDPIFVFYDGVKCRTTGDRCSRTGPEKYAYIDPHTFAPICVGPCNKNPRVALAGYSNPCGRNMAPDLYGFCEPITTI